MCLQALVQLLIQKKGFGQISHSISARVGTVLDILRVRCWSWSDRWLWSRVAASKVISALINHRRINISVINRSIKVKTTVKVRYSTTMDEATFAHWCTQMLTCDDKQTNTFFFRLVPKVESNSVLLWRSQELWKWKSLIMITSSFYDWCFWGANINISV